MSELSNGHSELSRRNLLLGGGAAASPYGPTAPVNDITTGLPLSELPAGLTYKSHGRRGDIMGDGLPTPGNHDGMGVVVSRRVGRSNEIILVWRRRCLPNRDSNRSQPVPTEHGSSLEPIAVLSKHVLPNHLQSKPSW